MSAPKKLLILLPDGVGLRNFAFTSFVETGKKLGWEVIFWNHTPFNLKSLGYDEIKIRGRVRSWTDLLKKAKIEAELNHFTKTFNDQVYQTYKFPVSLNSLKAIIKRSIVVSLVKKYKGSKGLKKLSGKIKNSERKGALYTSCLNELKDIRPDFIFCTNQRPVNAIAPLTAAKDLDIPTACFIFSWDNLPKATMVVDTDHYFVWSDYMQRELLNYYPDISIDQTHITGSPQFEPHFDQELKKTRKDFMSAYGLDESKKYICFSGDDRTTCPDDPQYLRDLAETIKDLNEKGMNLGIIFRRCPVDFSDRYDKVLEDHSNEIRALKPKWQRVGDTWNTVLPTKEDLELQINTILHCNAVVNLASSMVFDFAIFGKPCLYLNYEVDQKTQEDWSPRKVYNFVHFRSMPTGNEVYWLNSKKDFSYKLKNALNCPSDKTEIALEWFKKINIQPAQSASKRIWKKFDTLYEKR
ncbi:UDP-glycosyltransferase [Christiangramia echinicola]|uniref:UDP-glycosyltransferase n=1 Tax=Christiangramia echinicola TaxID=279359 RepID=A0A1H1L537_9FLAO|nr:UDP-glycosyltransferase [Christiangramia echinicola]SDR69392.1 hypothetical protein SAMN04488552_0552 [Christiangramia echinicola]